MPRDFRGPQAAPTCNFMEPILPASIRSGPAPPLFPETPWQLISRLISIIFFGRKVDAGKTIIESSN